MSCSNLSGFFRISFHDLILKGKIVFWKDLNAYYKKSFSNACNNDDEISENDKNK